MRRPPEVPALVMAARERAGQLKFVRGPSPFEKSRFKKGLNDAGPNLQIESGAFPIRLQKRSVIKSPVLTSAS